MKILCFTELGAPGAENAIRWLKERGHTIAILCLQPAPRGYKPNIQRSIDIYYIFKNRRRKRINLASQDIIRAAKKIINIVKPDVILVFFVTYYGWLAYLSGFRPYVVTVMGGDIHFFHLFSKKEKILTLSTLENADGIVSVSQEIRQKIIRLGIKNKINEAIWVGANTKIFKPRDGNSQIIKKLGIKNPNNVVLSPRAFHKTYNIATIIKAVPHVLSKYPETVFLFASYKLNTSAYERYLKQLVKKLKVTYAVRFMSIQSQILMSRIYNLSRCFISIPSADGTPASLHEGMACNAIPIVSSLPTTKAWINNGKNGIVIEKTHPSNVAKAIIRVFREKSEKLEEMFEINKELVKIKAEFDSCRQKEEDLYKTVIKRHSNRDG